MYRLLCSFIVAALFCIDPAIARSAPQGDEVDQRIERARRIERWPETLRDSLVAPQWLAGGDRLVFWDAIGPSARSWVLVDAARGTRAPVIGPAELRAQLAALTGKDVPLPAQLPFILTPGDRGLLFRIGGDGFGIDFASSKVRRIAGSGIAAQLLNGAIASSTGDRAAVRQGDGFAVIDGSGRTLIARTGTPDLAWQLPEKPWSPDGRLAVWLVDQRGVHHIPVVDYTHATEQVTMVPYAKVGTPIAKATLHLFDPASGALTPVPMTQDEGYRWLAGWRADGSALVLHLARDGKRLDLLAVARDGAVRTLLREERRDTKIADLNFAADSWGAQVTLLPRGRGFLWMSERDGWRHVYRYHEDGRLAGRMTRGAFPVMRVDRVAEDGTLIVTAAADPSAPYDERLYRVARGGGSMRPIATEPGVHLAIASPSGRYLVDSRSSWSIPRIRDLRRIDGTATMRLTTADARAVAAAGRTPPESIKMLAADGATLLYGALHRPFGFDPAQRYPVIAYVYGGPFGTVVARNFTGSTMMRRAETLAAAGFVVVAIDVRGSAGRMKAFGDATYGRIGQSEIADYVAGLRQLGAKHPWMDLSRVGVHGHSWGGYFAIRAMLTAPDMFKAGYAGAPGALDEDALVNEPDMGLYQANPAGYAAGSNLALADRLVSPLRIMHGTADINAPLSSSMRLVGALIRANKPVELLAMPGVGHDPEGTAGDYYRDDVIRFFLRTLPERSTSAR
jgi:dipeptidyl aminopeptidase/acylaminoacyl peptidase